MNLVVFYSILSVILIANLWVLRHPPVSTRWPFLGLFATLALAYTVPARALLPLGDIGQWIVGGMLIALPILFAAVIFAVLFRTRTRNPTASLAANLLGAIVGGVLEYGAMVVGIKALYIIAAACYGLVVLTSLRRGLPAATVPRAER